MIEEKELERINFENLIHFYGPELRRILRGENGCMVFSQRERKRLRAKGVLLLIVEGTRRRITLNSRTIQTLRRTEGIQ